MRKAITMFLIMCTAAIPALAQNDAYNISVSGQWNNGRCEAIFRRNGYVFIGNGSNIDIYRNLQSGGYQKVASHSVAHPVYDLWVRQYNDPDSYFLIYAACGNEGIAVIRYNEFTRQFDNVSSLNTPGFASGIMQFSNKSKLYVADGDAGLTVVNLNSVNYPNAPSVLGSFSTSGFAHELWVADDTTVYVAADLAGVVAVKTSPSAGGYVPPQLLDSIQLSTAYSGTVPALSVKIVSDVLYVAAGIGGLMTVRADDPENLLYLGNLNDTVPYTVHDVWLSGTDAYLAIGDEGIYGPVDVSNPSVPVDPSFSAVSTGGIASRVVVSGDTAFVAAGYGGHVLVDITQGFEPSILSSIETGDFTYGVDMTSQNLYAACGRAGVKVFSTLSTGSIQPVGSVGTRGTAHSIAVEGGYAYVADGASGMSIIDISAPADPALLAESFNPGTIETRDIAIGAIGGTSMAFLACGADGVKVVNISGSIFQAAEQETPGNAVAVAVNGSRLAIADSTGIYTYQVSDQGNMNLERSMTTGSIQAMDVFLSGDTLFVANGQYGFMVWDLVSNTVDNISTAGSCTGIFSKGKALYISESNRGLTIYDFSSSGEYTEVGYYNTGGRARDLAVSGDYIGVANGEDGVFLCKSRIKPSIQMWPTTLNFGPVPQGQARPKIMWVKNTGTTLLKITGITLGKVEYSFSESVFEVAPGDTHRVVCYFSPTQDVPPDEDYPTTASVRTNADTTVYCNLTGVNHAFNNKAPYESDIFARGLYHFDESPGSQTASDASGQFLTATVHGGVHTGEADAVFGTSFKFDGVSSSRVTVGASPFHDFHDTPFTVELWFKMVSPMQSRCILLRRGDYSAQTRQYEIGFQTSGDLGIYGIVWPSEGEFVTLSSGDAANIKADQWYHVAMTWDSDSLRLYINSVVRDKALFRGTLYNEISEPLAIGASANGDAALNGYVDEVRISRGVARQSWEYNVNQSRVAVKQDTVEFGNVLRGSSRDLMLRLSNPGTQALTVDSIYTKTGLVTVNPLVIPDMNFYVPAKGDTALWLTYAPTAAGLLSSNLVITSSDPTYPRYEVLLTGQAVETLPAGEYETDNYTIGLYHVSQESGTTVFDDSGNNLDGVWTPDTRTGSAKFGDWALQFDGQNDVCVITPSGSQFIGPEWGGLTAEMWFFLTNNIPGRRSLISRGNASGMQFDIALDDRQIIGRAFYQNGTARTVSAMNIEKGQWYHTALVLEKDSLRLFINGTQLDAVEFTAPVKGARKGSSFDTVPLYLGNSYLGSEPLDGYIDEVRISNIARRNWEFNVGMARADLDSTSLHFGTVVLSGKRTLSVTIRNPGIDTLDVTDIQSSNQTAFSVPTADFQILPGELKELAITFEPSDAISYDAEITMKTTDPFWPVLTVDVYGNGQAQETSGSYPNDLFTSALYHFTAFDGTTVPDSSSNGANGQVRGGVSLVTGGRFGSAVALDGSSGRMVFPVDQDLIDSRSFTAEIWFSINKKPLTSACLFAIGSDTQRRLSVFLDAQKGLVGDYRDSRGDRHEIQSGDMDTLKLSQWYNASLAWNGQKVFLSLNDEVVDSLVFSDSLLTTGTDSLFIGSCTNSAGFFNGFVDEFRLSRVFRESWEVNVLPRNITVSATVLDFSTVLLGQARDLPVLVSNTGDQDLYISDFTLTNAAYSVADQEFTLNGLKNKLMYITYDPQTVGDDTGSVIFYTNDTDKPSIRIVVTGSCARGGSIGAPGLDSHTLALYRFEETSGSTVFDSTENKYDGQIHNGVARTTGYLGRGRGLQFDGVNDYADIPSGSMLNFDMDQQSFTIEFYFKTDTVTQTLISMGQAGQAPDFEISVNPQGKINVKGFGEGGRRVNDNVWHHLAFTYSNLDNTTGKLYIDGMEVWSKPKSSTELTTVSVPLYIGVSYTGTGGVEKQYDGYFDELRISDIVRMRWEFNFIDVGVKVDSLSPAKPVFQQDASVYIHVPASLEANQDSVLVHFRNAGETEFTDSKGTRINDSTYTAVIPGSGHSLTGIEYYVSVVYGQGDIFTKPMADPENNPLSAPVVFTGVNSEQLVRARTFRMVSVPFSLDSTDVPAVFEDDLGVYNPYKWKLFWWHRADSVYVEYNRSADRQIFDVAPGRAFWIITDKDETFDVDGGNTVTTDSSYALSIRPGWNMIGVPFNFDVRWDDCSRSSDSVGTVWYYDSVNGAQMDYSLLKPWKGYWILNTDTATQTLIIPPKKAEESVSKPIHDGLLAHTEDGSWLIKISASAEKCRDMDNYMGVRTGARNGRDKYDRFEPPVITDSFVRITVGCDEETADKAVYAADIRQPGEDGYVWYADCTTRNLSENVTLTWLCHSPLPQGWDAYLFDLYEGTSVNMKSVSSLEVKPIDSKLSTRRFKVIAGTREFIESESGGIPLGPVSFSLQQNYPNPFNPETTIRYSISKRTTVKLMVYNMLGQVVRILRDKEQKAGFHTVVWDGRDTMGRAVSSGVYVYKISAAGKTLSRKMVIVH